MENFQAFTTRFSQKTNVLFTDVGVSPAFDPTVTVTNRPPFTKLVAIWDTGASCTVISKQFAQQIGLIPTGKITITGVNNSTVENTYLVNVYLPNHVGLIFVKIAEAPALTGNAGMLIGMDIISSGDFSTYVEAGKTVMSFRIPSLGGNDYVEMANRLQTQNMITQKIDEQRRNRKQLSKKDKEKRKRQRKNRKRNRHH